MQSVVFYSTHEVCAQTGIIHTNQTIRKEHHVQGQVSHADGDLIDKSLSQYSPFPCHGVFLTDLDERARALRVGNHEDHLRGDFWQLRDPVPRNTCRFCPNECVTWKSGSSLSRLTQLYERPCLEPSLGVDPFCVLLSSLLGSAGNMYLYLGPSLGQCKLG